MAQVMEHTKAVAGPGDLRSAGIAALAGAVTMVVGAALYLAGGADPWKAVSSGDMATYLADAADGSSVLYAGLAAWIVGVLGLAIGGRLLAAHGDGPLARAAGSTFTIGGAAAIPAFVAMAALIRLAGSGSASHELADTLAFFATTLDDVATIVVVGLSPALVVLSARAAWVPRWLFALGLLAGVAGLISAGSIFAGASSTLGFVIVPLGLGWMAAAGVVAIRRG